MLGSRRNLSFLSYRFEVSDSTGVAQTASQDRRGVSDMWNTIGLALHTQSANPYLLLPAGPLRHREETEVAHLVQNRSPFPCYA